MLGRVGLFGRIMLIVMGALSTLVLATIGLDRWQHEHQPVFDASRFPRVDQAANIILLLRQADPAERPAILRAVSGISLKAEILDEAPPRPDLIVEPRLAFRLGRLVAQPEADVVAYTDADLLRDGIAPADVGREMRRVAAGRLALATARLADGRTLLIAFVDNPRSTMPWILGLPLSAWVAVLGVAVTGLALLGASHEIAPLRRLTEALGRFDGRAPQPIAPVGGAPEIRRLAEAARAMQERISALVAERLLLIGAISHDLKTYLTRLRLRAEAVAVDDARDRFVADLDAMTELLETSLSFARGMAVEARRVRVDLGDLVAAEVAEHAALGAPVSLVGDDVPDAVVTGDAGALRRVVANLIDNAAKFGRSRVTAAVERAGTTCRVVVEDDGPGIPAADRAAVFTPYHRLEQSRSRGTGGSGLGLAIARQIVEAHGGTIEAAEASLGGARIVVTLPTAP